MMQTLRRMAISGKLRRRALPLMLVGVVVALVAYYVALPLLISTSQIRANMEAAISAWTGTEARIAGEPELHVWPSPSLTLNDVTLTAPGRTAPLARAGAINARFSLLAALRGAPVLSDFRLIKPVVTISRDRTGRYDWPAGGWMATTIEGAAGKGTTAASLPALGRLTIESGTVTVADATAGPLRASDVSGTIEWPSPGERLNIRLAATIRGERLDWSFASDEPLALLAGQEADAETGIVSALGSFRFEGRGRLAAQPLATGRIDLSLPSPAAIMSWLGRAPLPCLDPASVAISATVFTGPGTIKLDNLAVSLGSASATGVLDLRTSSSAPPRLAGTLAFDRIDLTGQALQLAGECGALEAVVGGQFAMDMRLSAGEILSDRGRLQDVAAGIMIENGRASLDLGDGLYADGALSGRFAATAGETSLQMSLKNGVLDTVFNDLAVTGPRPSGRGTLNVSLAQPRSGAATDVTGTIQLSADNGTLQAFDLDTWRSLATARRFFNLAEASGGSYDYTALDIDVRLANGFADVTRGIITGTDGTILSLSGVVPYRKGGLALKGSVASPFLAGSVPQNFFVGGVWPDPVISPVGTPMP